jgi:hypothetical protein
MIDAAVAAGISGLITSAAAGIALIVKAITTSRCSQIATPCCTCTRAVDDVEPAAHTPR